MKRGLSRAVISGARLRKRQDRYYHAVSFLATSLCSNPLPSPRITCDRRQFFVSSSTSQSQPWVAQGLSERHTKDDVVNSRFATRQAHRLLDELDNGSSATSVTTEQWMEAEDCLCNLANARTVESVDLTLLLLDKLLKNRHQMLLQDQSDTSSKIAYTQYLVNWELWHSVLINWQQVSKEQLSSSSYVDDSKLTSPSKLLAMLDHWNTLVASTDTSSQHFSCTSSKTLSLLIDVVGRRGKLLAALPHGSLKEVLELAELAESLLFRMIDSAESHLNSFRPSTTNLNMVLSLWARSAHVDRAWLLLKRASKVISPDRLSYNSVMQAYAVTGNGAAAEQVLHEMCLPDTPIKPDVTTWNTVLAAWARSADKVTAAERVEQLLVNMMMYGGDSNSDDETFGPPRRQSAASTANLAVKPNLTTFNTALSAWARVGEADTCERLLGEMRDLHKSGRLEDPPDIVSYATVMNAFAKAGQPDKAEALSDEMYTAFMQGMAGLKPTIPILTTILDAYSRQIGAAAKSNDSVKALNSIERARRVFQRMRELNQYGFLESGPDTTAYNVMLTCYLRSNSVKTFPRVNTAAEQADMLLQEMKQVSEGVTALPNFKSYSLVIQMWLQRPNGMSRAIELLDELWVAQTTGNPGMKPDALSLHCIIVGFCHAKRPDIGQEILMNVCEARRRNPSGMIEPKIGSFGSIVAALSRSNHSNSVRVAQSLVNKMEALHKMGVLSEGPDYLMYRSLLSMWAYSDRKGSAKKAYLVLLEMRRRASKGETSMQPDIMSYNQVIYALSRGNPEPVYAERVLHQMYDDYKKGAKSAKPDIKSFNTVLSGWARLDHPLSIDRADALFQEMLRLHQAGDLVCDAVTYNSMLNCLASTASRVGAERAEVIVQNMKELSNAGEGTFRPNYISYGCLIKAWANAGDAARAHAVLSEMYEEFTSGKVHMKPQLRHFEQVANAWSASADAFSTQHVQSILEMKALLYPDSKVHAIASRLSPGDQALEQST